jgi:hypothetical protein
MAICTILAPAITKAQNYVATLQGVNEVPPNASPATGIGHFTLNATHDTLFYTITWSGLMCNQTAAHIHRGVAGVAGPVLHPLQNLAAGSASGAWALSAQNVIELNSDSLYVNVHSSCFPGGEIRGQLTDSRLPVEFGTFSAVGRRHAITLSWNTHSENDNQAFEIWRDGAHHATVPSQGNGATEHDYQWNDNVVTAGRNYHYTLISVDVHGAREELASVDAATFDGSGAVREFALHQNYPNPFNPTTTITFDLAEAGHVTLTVYNVLMQQVGTIADGDMNAGEHSMAFNGADLATGLYIYELKVGTFRDTRKMLLLK